MSHNSRLNVIVLLCSTIISILALEIVLRVIDPLGAWVHATDSNDIIFKNGVYDENVGYLINSGKYERRGWTVTIGEDGWREVVTNPQTSQCTIATIGDSVTFGWGIDDEDIWPNLMANEYRDVKFINRSLAGYNSSNIRGVVETVDADGFIYLAVGNDNQPPISGTSFWQPALDATGISVYVEYATRKTEQRALWELFEEDMQVILGYQPLVFTFYDPANDVTKWLEDHYPEVVVINIWTHSVSIADGHPDALGHMQIAEQMYSHVGLWLGEVCN